MSEAATETIVGKLDGITEKPSGWMEIAVSVDGYQYPVKMATKLQPLIELARAAGTETMAWTFKKQDSDKINPNSGKPFVNRYFEGVKPLSEATGSEATPAAAAQGGAPRAQFKTSNDVMTKEEWARKDSAIHKMACIKTAADALRNTLPSDPTPDDLAKYLTRCATLYGSWHRAVLAERDDPTGEDIPF